MVLLHKDTHTFLLFSIRLINVNDAPVVSLHGLLFSTATYDEAVGPARIADVFNVSDSDNTTLAGLV